MEIHYGLDSNIILLDAKNVTRFKNVIIPLTVIQEIDTKKTLNGELGYQAREFARLLTKAEKISVDTLSKGIVNLTAVHLYLEGTDIYLVDTGEYHTDVMNDEKIIQTVKKYGTIYKNPVVFVSNDVNARTLGDMAGIVTQPLAIQEDVPTEYFKEITLSNDEFHEIDGKYVHTITDHSPYTFNYLINHESNGHVKLAKVTQGKLDVIHKEDEKFIREQPIPPMNMRQLLFSQAILDEVIDIVLCEAPAGSGKTACALSAAIKLVKKGKYDGITYIRNSVNDVDINEEVGFLSGNEEKFNVYLHPFYDTMDFIVRTQLKKRNLKGKELEEAVVEATEKLMLDCNMEATITLGMRGRTFHNKIVILDEFQNTTASAAQKILTRMGKGTKVIVIGSNRQIDNAYVSKNDNGMSLLMKGAVLAPDGVNVHVIQLDKVVRSPLAEFAEMLYSNELKTE